jgi:glycosyltransferase involved in cell wall biosynthesis
MRLHRKKRPLPLLRAFANATSRIITPARLLIAGEGPERESLEREARHLGLVDGRNRVELLGWRSRDELRSLYAQAEGFVLASTRESFGIAALEARAAGLPVIAMRASGSSDFLTHDLNSLICDDDDELVRAIARFAQDAPLRARLAATPTSLQRFDWRAVLAQHETVYGLAMTRASAAAEAVATSG